MTNAGRVPPRGDGGCAAGLRARRAGRAPLSLTARFAILFALFAASLLLVVGLVLERAAEVHFDELDQHELAAKLVVVGNMLARTTSDEAFAALPQRLEDALLGHEMVAALVLDEAGREIFAARAERFEPVRHDSVALAEGVRNWEHADRPHIGSEASFRIPLPEPITARVLIGLDISHHAHFLTQVRNRLWVGISVVALLAAGLGWVAARNGLAPVRRVTATASRLSAERLGERLSERDAPAEMLELVEAFNGMLDRLEEAFRRLNDFSADIAHELRTPVSNLMTETQVALSRARSADEYRETLHSNLEEFDRLARMIGDMLFLAKADNGLLPRPAETVELEAEAHALADFYEALADEKNVRLAVSGAAAVIGDRLMLRRALSNLVSNAIRHTPAGGTIDIRIDTADADVRLSVSNPGEAIAPEQLPRLFERFHRVEASRTRHGEGSGLGLAITRSIVEAHGGHVEVASASGRTTFTVHLPRVKAPGTDGDDY
ncbi:MAG TPA: heavy metal sensor histidine kinase [Rhodocyclaceae bacterium]|nr:heavy metal sensor histidine kinase [Rhodocyclaceae bacterium]